MPKEGIVKYGDKCTREEYSIFLQKKQFEFEDEAWELECEDSEKYKGRILSLRNAAQTLVNCQLNFDAAWEKYRRTFCN